MTTANEILQIFEHVRKMKKKKKTDAYMGIEKITYIKFITQYILNIMSIKKG